LIFVFFIFFNQYRGVKPPWCGIGGWLRRHFLLTDDDDGVVVVVQPTVVGCVVGMNEEEVGSALPMTDGQPHNPIPT
jgi:hypothetical protein